MHEGTGSLSYDFGGLLIYLVTGFLFTYLLLFLSRLLMRRRPSLEKHSTYECGETPVGSAWVKFNIRFYVIALVFLIFDVEVAFIFPAAAVFREWVLGNRGGLAFAEIFIFVAILLFGLAYVWGKGDLEWVKSIREDSDRQEDEAPRKVVGA